MVGTPTGAPSTIANGIYALTAQNSGKVAGIVGNSTATGAAVEQRTDTGVTAQDWTLTDLNNGYYKPRLPLRITMKTKSKPTLRRTCDSPKTGMAH